MDKIFLENIRLLGRHGVNKYERHVEQEFEVSITAEFDTKKSAKSDKLKDTIDYSKFLTIAEEVVSQKPVYLIEKLAEEIAERILADKRIHSVTITIKKPEVMPNGIPGVTITRPR